MLTIMTELHGRPCKINRARTGNGPAPDEDDHGPSDEDDEALPSDPSKCSVAELREILGNLGLDSNGLKPVLVERVKLIRNGVAADSDDDDPDACAAESTGFHQSIQRQGLAAVVDQSDDSSNSDSEPEPGGGNGSGDGGDGGSGGGGGSGSGGGEWGGKIGTRVVLEGNYTSAHSVVAAANAQVI
jgi:hypothetical protein